MLTDRQRVELAIPAHLTFGLVIADCFGPDPAADPEEAKAYMRETVAKLRDLLTRACYEPLADLPDRQAAKVARRIDRLAREIAKPYDGQPAIKLALVIFYLLRHLIETGTLEVYEGSAFGEAWRLLEPMFAHGFDEARLDQSARKQAGKLLDSLRREGLYQGVMIDG